MATIDSNGLAVSITLTELRSEIAGRNPPIVLDVRRDKAWRQATATISGALRRDPEHLASWAATLPASQPVVACCVHGGEVSRAAATALAERGIAARYLEGGIEGWIAAGGAADAKPAGASTRWITRERPRIDRIACPWLVARFVDPGAEFLYVPPARVLEAARDADAIPYDVADVHFTHEGERCSFDAFVKHYRLRDPALAELASIVRGADTARLELAAQAPGLAAISLGLSRNFADDHEMLAHGMVLYDALYTWCKEGKDEVHTWNPRAYAAPAAVPA
ncbi:MAG TPA: chromate resistance protein ChrB domain-containing protein [Usitatibacter sp.]|nr:chromate resistance protein ChrB domain-containing protein [Usitatibacter sp.]